MKGDKFSIKENQEFYDTIEILGESYSDVFSMKVGENNPKYYYNAAKGLVGFRDDKGEFWKLIE